MKTFKETSIKDFKAWSGAVETKNIIIKNNMAEAFDDLIEELYPEGIEETQLNDVLWFDADWIFEQLGIEVNKLEEMPENELGQEVCRVIKDYSIYICGTWCEVTRYDEVVFEGSIKAGTTPEQVAEYLNI